MPSSKTDLILHPVRLRIITATTTDRVTAKDLAQALPDVPQTTLYRHINALVEGGMLEVVDEIPQRGTVERVYSLAAPPSLQPEDLRGLSKEDYQRTFTIVMTSLLNEAISYLDQVPVDEEFDLLGAGFNYNQITLKLTDEEYQAMNQQILEIMLAASQNEASDDRKRRIFSFLFIPVER